MRRPALPPESKRDYVAVEEPLQISVAGEPIALTMRTPGHDHELAAGFLFAEGVITSRADLGSLSVCGRVGGRSCSQADSASTTR